MFTAVGWLDPWYYIGYGLNYDNPDFLDDYYKISRLPWILIEYFVRDNFSYYYSGVIIQMTLMMGTTAAMYAALFRTIGRTGALFGVLFYATYVYSYASGGADYHNGCGGLFFALSWICAIRAGETQASARWTVATGAMIGLSVHSIIVMVNLAPIPIVFLLAQYRTLNHRWPPIAKTLLWLASGALLVTALLCIVNWSVGRNPLFFLLQFKLASSFIADSSHQTAWWHDWGTPWYLSVNRLYLIPAAAGLAVTFPLAFYIWKSEKNKTRRDIALLYVLLYAFYGALWIFWQSVGQTALDWIYFAYPLIFPLSGLVGAAASVHAEKLDREAGIYFSLIPAFSVFLVLAPFALHPVFYFEMTDKLFFAVIGFNFLFLVFILARGVGRWQSTFASGLLCSVAISILNYNAGRGEIDHFKRDSCHYNAINGAAIEEAHRFLRESGFGFDRILIWGDANESVRLPLCPGAPGSVSLGQIWPSLVSTGFRYVAAPWEAKKLEEISIRRFQEISENPTLIVQVSNSLISAEELRNRFAVVASAEMPGQINSHQLKTLPLKLYFFEVGGMKQK
ncbi:hypothetical protein [Rhizobium sp. L1K21]|uniref:hypothetical protein n=1 Tax=Rhizobium sp. L1K21 TaxID=2954933 RepID=UPI0020920694|nr:hypothetical protein [Rhizobium sp. L1K21]MCO6187966.1 hypothetical protein [Rhizobium sp. L1K21]